MTEDEDKHLLKKLLEQRTKGPFVTTDEGERRTKEMVERKRRAVGTDS